jgi:hypothetical protein
MLLHAIKGEMRVTLSRGEPWTVEEEMLVASSLAGGMTIAEVAKLVGRSQSAVHCKALNIGVKQRTRSAKRPRAQRRPVADLFLS